MKYVGNTFDVFFNLLLLFNFLINNVRIDNRNNDDDKNYRNNYEDWIFNNKKRGNTRKATPKPELPGHFMSSGPYLFAV